MEKTTVGKQPNHDLKMMTLARYSPTVNQCLK